MKPAVQAKSSPPGGATVDERIPFVRLDDADPNLLAELLQVVERVAHEGAFTLGSGVEDFEQRFAAMCGSVYAIGVSSGTTALELALRGLGIGPGDEVIVPTNSFVATAEAVTSTGALPRLVDVDEDTALITADIIEEALTSRTRCVIPVHLFGRTVDLDPILEICRERDIAVVEDACQAHGARYQGRSVGSLGDAGCFSFYPTKNLGAWGDGGAVVTGDQELADRIRLFRSHGETSRHRHELPAGTHRLDALQAAILTVKLDRLHTWNVRRRAVANSLRASLRHSDVALPSPVPAGDDHVFHLFVVRTDERDALRRHLHANGIASAVHYPVPIHLQPAYSHLEYERGSLPTAERLASESCSLPIFPSIEDWQIGEISSAVGSFVPAQAV